MDIAVIGLPGSGKTAFMAMAAIRFRDNGFNCFSNFKIHVPGEEQPISQRVYGIEDLEKVRDGWLFIDEIAASTDSRRSMSTANILATAALQRDRKREVSLMWSAQIYGMADNRLIENTKYVILPEMYYTVDGKQGSEEFVLEDDFFRPINRLKYLPFARIRAPMVSAWAYSNMKELTKEAVFKWFDFPVQPISFCYDTWEEVSKFANGHVEKSIIVTEPERAKILEKFVGVPVKLIPRSGNKQKGKMDMEYTKDDILYVVDSTTLKKGIALRTYGKENMKRFKVIEKERKATTLFIFDYPSGSKNYYMYPTKPFWNDKRTQIPFSELKDELKIKIQN